MKKVFTLLTLALLSIGTAWGADEVVVIGAQTKASDYTVAANTHSVAGYNADDPNTGTIANASDGQTATGGSKTSKTSNIGSNLASKGHVRFTVTAGETVRFYYYQTSGSDKATTFATSDYSQSSSYYHAATSYNAAAKNTLYFIDFVFADAGTYAISQTDGQSVYIAALKFTATPAITAVELMNGGLLTDDEKTTATGGSGVNVSFGITATGTRVEASDPTSVATLSGNYKSGENVHGWNSFTAEIPVAGPTKLVFGTCTYGNGSITVKNSSSETVLSMNNNTGVCYHNDKVNNVVTGYYEGSATTLTITANAYVPYFAFQAVTEDQIEYNVTFDISGAGVDANSKAPANTTIKKGSDFTIPANHTIYKEGKTLTGWTPDAGVHNYDIGSNITSVSGNLTLTPVFADNDEATLAALLNANASEFEVTWNMGNSSGAVFNMNSGSVNYVAHPTINTKTVDLPMVIDATDGKIDNSGASRGTNAQTNSGLKFTVPVVDGSVVTLTTYSAQTGTINGTTEYTKSNSDKTGTYTYSGATRTIDIVLGENNYTYTVKVTYPGRKLATPTITPAFFIGSSQEVTITTTDAGTTIYYTLDGTDPTTGSSVYDGDSKPSVTSTTTVKAYAIKDGFIDSDIATVTVTKTALDERVNVTEEATWDWSKFGTAEIRLTSETTPKKDDEVVLSNAIKYGLCASIGGDFGNAQQLTVKGEYLVRDSKYFQGGQINFYTTKPGTLSVEYTNTGNRSNEDDRRFLNVNGDNCGEGSMSSKEVDKVTESGIIVSAGLVTIKGTLKKDGSNQYLRFYKITFTPLASGDAVQISSAGSATHVLADDIDFTKSTGVTAYKAVLNAEKTEVDLVEVTAAPEGTPLIIQASADTYVLTKADATPPAVTGNDLKVATVDMKQGDGTANTTMYVLNKVGGVLGFYKLSATGTLKAGKCYIEIPNDSAPEMLGFGDVIDDAEGEATGIESVDERQLTVDCYYDLQGRRVAQPTKGLYIVNGKKHVVK